MRKFFTKHFWHGVGDKIRTRFKKPRSMANEPEINGILERVASSDGVVIMSLEIWSDGKKPCSKHCWHPVETSMKHKLAAGVHSDRHEDLVCCGCTHGMCRIGHEQNDNK